jgi:SWI/SNF-related matrix-associated actin-dependent regulator of chromatin subfamily A3
MTSIVNRIGQTKEVRVFRLVAKDTIEDKVLKIQAAKTELIKEVRQGIFGQS